jgi:hypothetical protein
MIKPKPLWRPPRTEAVKPFWVLIGQISGQPCRASIPQYRCNDLVLEVTNAIADHPPKLVHDRLPTPNSRGFAIKTGSVASDNPVFIPCGQLAEADFCQRPDQSIIPYKIFWQAHSGFAQSFDKGAANRI